MIVGHHGLKHEVGDWVEDSNYGLVKIAEIDDYSINVVSYNTSAKTNLQRHEKPIRPHELKEYWF